MTFEEYFEIAKAAFTIQKFLYGGSIMPTRNELRENKPMWRELPKGTSKSLISFKSIESMNDFLVTIDKVQRYCESRMLTIDRERYDDLFIIDDTIISERCYEER